MQRSAFVGEVDGVSESQWSETLNSFADANIYQTWAYGAVSWGHKNVSHLVLKDNERITSIAQLRIIRPTPLKYGLAILRWGPVHQLKGDEVDGLVLQRMAVVLHDEYVRKRGLFLRVIPNALKSTKRAAAFQAAFSQYTAKPFRSGQTQRTFILDLCSPLDELRKRLDQKWRNQLNRAEKNNLKIIEDDNRDLFDIFLKMYDQMRSRKSFQSSTDVHAFKRIQKELSPGQKMKVLICERNGLPVAGLVGSAIGDTGIYLHGATSNEGLDSKGAYLLQWRMIEWLKERGVKYYDLGGINPETNPGVYHFKSGLRGRDEFYMSPLCACESLASATLQKAGDFADARFRRRLTGFFSLRGRRVTLRDYAGV